MPIPHVTPGNKALAAEQNALIDQANATAATTARHADAISSAAGVLDGHEHRLAAIEQRPAPALGRLADVTTSGAKAGQVLAFGGNRWAPADAVTGTTPTSLGRLADVSTQDATAGQVLKYDGAKWAPGTDNTGGGGGCGATTLDELADVSTTGATDGAVLTYNSGQWTPAAPCARPPATATDTLLYGDAISSHPRAACTWGEALGNGYMTATATRAAQSVTVTELRVCATAAATGAGTFDLKLYSGPSLSDLAERAFVYGEQHVTSTGVKRFRFDPLTLHGGDYVGICLIVTGWTGAPRLSSTPAGAGAQLLLSEQPYSVYRAGQTFPPPTALDMTAASWTRSNQLFWFALAP